MDPPAHPSVSDSQRSNSYCYPSSLSRESDAAANTPNGRREANNTRVPSTGPCFKQQVYGESLLQATPIIYVEAVPAPPDHLPASMPTMRTPQLHESKTFFRLNDPGVKAGPQEFVVQGKRHVPFPKDIMDKTEPGGMTPLTNHIFEIRGHIQTTDLELFDDENEVRDESPKGKYSAATHSSSSGSSQRSSNPSKQSSNPSKQRRSLCNLYGRLLEDSAYEHAMRAGFLWQSIVGQHVKFPKTWWNGARGPPMGNSAENGRPWVYYGRQPVYNNYVLTQLVQGRASAGRLLLHICVQDLMTMSTIQDIAIGCFHPNAKGIRQTDQALRSLEACREVWMAVRKHSDSVSAVDSLLDMAQQQWSRSPLGHGGRRITNTNVRSVFGERPPLETIFMSEDEVYERLSMRILQPHDPVSPCVAVLEEFVFA